VFPRLLSPESIKETIARGVANGQIAYVGKTPSGKYQPFHFERTISAADVEVSDEMFVITRETAEAYREALRKPQEQRDPTATSGTTPAQPAGTTAPPTQPGLPIPGGQSPPPEVPAQEDPPAGLCWSGEVPAQKWMNFYTKVLTKLGVGSGLKLTVKVEFNPDVGVSGHKRDEVRGALRELGLSDELK
jgi:hypothetical protein